MQRLAPETRASLILRLKSAEDVEAWEEFVALYSPVIYRAAIKRGFQPEDAENIVQEVLISVSTSVSSWLQRDDRGSFRAWILRIARNEATDHLKRRATRRLGLDGSQAHNAIMQTEAIDQLPQILDLEYERSVFEKAISQVRKVVSEGTWLAFWLTRIEGHSVEDVSHRLNMRIGNVYLARSRVISKIQQVVRSLEVSHD